MNDLIIEATQYTPSILMLSSGEICIKGKSYPENTFEFYQPVMSWLKRYFDQPKADSLTVIFEIIYFNSSSSKLFFDFFDILNGYLNFRVEKYGFNFLAIHLFDCAFLG